MKQKDEEWLLYLKKYVLAGLNVENVNVKAAIYVKRYHSPQQCQQKSKIIHSKAQAVSY